MAEFNTGMSKVRQFTRTLELLTKAMKNLIENRRDVAEFKQFVSELNQADPKNPVMNDTNTVFYDVTGVGPDKMQEILKACNIRSEVFIDTHTGVSVVAVAKQNAPMANIALAKSTELGVTAAHVAPSDTEAIKKVTANMTQTPSPMVLASMQNGTAITKTFDSSRWMPLAQQMEAQGIPFGMTQTTDAKTGITSTTLIFDQKFALPVHNMDCAIEQAKTPAELSYSDFMRENLGKPIVEHAGLSEGQMHEIRNELCGCCQGYSVEKHQNGTYTMRYNAAQARQLEPTIAAVRVRSSGTNRDGQPIRQHTDHHAHYVSTQAEQARSVAVSKQNMIIHDAATAQTYTVTDKGLTGPDGKFIMRKDDAKFADTVHSVTRSMKAPVVAAAGPDGKVDMGLLSKKDIADAKASYAAAVPSEATVMAGQITAMKVNTEFSQPNASVAQVLNNTANFCRDTAEHANEETFKLGADEFDRHPEMVQRFEQVVSKLPEPEKAQLADGLRTAETEMARTAQIKTVSGEMLGAHDLSRELDRRDRADIENDGRIFGEKPKTKGPGIVDEDRDFVDDRTDMDTETIGRNDYDEAMNHGDDDAFLDIPGLGGE